VRKREARHGVAYAKTFSRDEASETRVTIIPTKKHRGSRPIPQGTLRAILGPRQTQIGVSGLLNLIELHGLR